MVASTPTSTIMTSVLTPRASAFHSTMGATDAGDAGGAGVVHVFGVPVAKIDSVFNRPQLSIQMKRVLPKRNHTISPQR